MSAGWSSADDHAAWVEGWGIFEAGDGDQLQRDDEAGTFTSDADAWAFVLAGAAAGRRLHQRALAELAEWNPHELVTIIAGASA